MPRKPADAARKPPPAASPPRGRLPAGKGLPRGLLATVGVWVVLYALAVVLPALVPTTNPLVRLGQDLVVPPLVFFACAAAGWAALGWLGFGWLGAGERLVLGLGLGLGALGLATFGLGLAGWTNMQVAPVVLLLVGAPTLRSMGAALGAWAGEARAALGPLGWVMLGLAAALAVAIVWAGWSPPIDYDEMEYHLALPKAYLAAGRIHDVPHNVLSYLPQGAEMLFQAAMSLRWTAAAPMYSVQYGGLLARVFNAYLALATALAVAAAAARLFGQRAAAPAAALYLAMPWVYAISYRAMAENAQLLHSTMALVAVLAYVQERRPGAAALAGAMAGLALGTKYLVWGFVFGPAVFWLAAEAVFLKPRRRGVRALALFAAAALAVASPWLVRNLAWTGNPVHPLLTSLFGPGPHWTAGQAAHFQAFHSPASLGLGDLAAALVPDRPLDAVPVVLALALGAAALARPSHRRPALGRAVYAAIVLAVWWFGTHHVMRHLVPIWPPLASLAAGAVVASEGWRGRRVVAGACVAAALAGLVVIGAKERDRAGEALRLALPAAAQAPGDQPTWSAYAIDYLNLGRDLPAAWRRRPPADRPVGVGLVGEARTLSLIRPVRYNTVWDTPWLAPAAAAWRAGRSADDVRGPLAALGVGTIYVNWLEIERFRGPGGYGWPEAIDEALFADWVKAGVLVEVAHFGAREGDTQPWPHVIYRVAYAE